MFIPHNPETVAAPVGSYNHGLEVGPNHRFLFISGEIPELSNGIVPPTFEEQCEAVWQNIERILNSAGMGIENLVKITTYLTDRSYATANGEIRRRHLGATKPALTVIITQTLDPLWLLEIDAIAAAPV